MAIPSIEPSEVGASGLLWLFFSYGYLLYSASNLISEGSELLLLVPSMAGLVGGVVLPVLGAVPDGAIILFSGLGGDLAVAQETLSVGVGALAGSTIMLLTVPWVGAVYSGRVDILSNGQLNYRGKPKLAAEGTALEQLTKTGVQISEAVQHGGVIMMLTTISYFLIQVPAQFLQETATSSSEVAAGEHYWALAGLIVCLSGLAIYMRLQLRISSQGQDRAKRMAVLKKQLKRGAMSLSGAVAASIRPLEEAVERSSGGEYESLATSGASSKYPSPQVKAFLKDVLADAFYSYDKDDNGMLDRAEVYVFFRDFHESISEKECFELFDSYDVDKSGSISLDEFIGLAYTLIKSQEQKGPTDQSTEIMAQSALSEGGDEGEEEEEVPEEFTNLSPDQQQLAIKRRAFVMLAAGTTLVVVFSDPMVDVLQEIAVRVNISPFYVSFVLAPLASNSSEVISSMYYASKKTRKTMTVALTALEGAACMNNTFCLSIFMGLVYFRGLAWQYTAETVAIIVVEFVVGLSVRGKTMTLLTAVCIFGLFPASIALVAILEALGFD